MQLHKSLAFKAPIVTLKRLFDDTIIVMDKSGTLRHIDTQTFKTIDGFKTKIEQERSWGNHMSVSASGKYAACVIPKTSKAALYDVNKKKLMYTSSRHKGDLESVCVDDDNHYFVTGGTDGKTFVWNLQTAKLVYAFPSHADYVTALDINSVWIASASYDKNISVLNLTTMQSPLRLKGHSSVIIQMKLLKNMRLLSIDKDGNILLWDLRTSKIVKRFSKMIEDVTCFSISLDERFFFVGGKLGTISVYEINNSECLKRALIKEKTKVTALSVIAEDQRLVVGTKEGQVNIYHLLPQRAELNQLLEHKAFDTLYAMAEENPLLRYSDIYETLEKLYTASIKKARKMLEMGQKENAGSVLKRFEKVPSKRHDIQTLFKDFASYERFKKCVDEKKYSLAYPLANQHPHFKQSDAYRYMENAWHIQFNKAKMVLLHKDGDDKVRRLLSDFKGISEKSILIQELFEQRTAYTLFKKKLANKDYIAIFNLLEKCPFIKEFDEYDVLINYADDTYIKAQKAIEEGDYTNGIKYAGELLGFPDLRADAQQMMDRAKVLQSFHQASIERNMGKMYEMIGRFPFLLEYKEARQLEDDWCSHQRLAEKYAAKGDVRNTVLSLEDFFNIKSKYMSIGIVFQQAYSAQLAMAIRSGVSSVRIQHGLLKYISFFGKDEHVENLIGKASKQRDENINVNSAKEGSLSLFRPTMIIDDIMER